MIKKTVLLLTTTALLSACASHVSQQQYQNKTAEQQKSKILQCQQLKDKMHKPNSATGLQPSHHTNMAAYRQYKALDC